MVEKFEEIDTDKTGTITDEGKFVAFMFFFLLNIFLLELRIWMKKVSKNSLNEEVLDDLIDGADIDGDGIIDYKKHLNLIANTLLQLNVSGNQVSYRNMRRQAIVISRNFSEKSQKKVANQALNYHITMYLH